MYIYVCVRVYICIQIYISFWSELSPPKPNRLRSGPRLPAQVISERTGAYLALAAKARFNKITLRGHA